MFKQIVLATDGSEVSINAAKKAVGMAIELKASLTTVFVCTPFPYLTPDEKDQFVDSARQVAENAFAQIGGQVDNKISFEAVFTEGKSVEKAVQGVLSDKNADLLVVGSHGYSGLNRMILGSVANKLASTVDVPVLIVR
ncbi:MAG: universal stress protein [Limnobacter sp.]|nr:universal stress protein [Limnobacter sp.]